MVDTIYTNEMKQVLIEQDESDQISIWLLFMFPFLCL